MDSHTTWPFESHKSPVLSLSLSSFFESQKSPVLSLSLSSFFGFQVSPSLPVCTHTCTLIHCTCTEIHLDTCTCTPVCHMYTHMAYYWLKERHSTVLSLGQMVQLIMIILSLTAFNSLLIGSKCIANGAHTNHC